MRTEIEVSRPLDSDPWPVVERFLRPPMSWLPPPASPLVEDEDCFVTTVHLGPLMHTIRIEVGDPWTLTDAVSRQLSWVPSDAAGRPVRTTALPSFQGRFTVRHHSPDLQLSLTGTYVPPGGALGAALDRALLHRSGDATATRLLEDVAEMLLRPSSERVR